MLTISTLAMRNLIQQIFYELCCGRIKSLSIIACWKVVTS